jgi:hypothetical protein
VPWFLPPYANGDRDLAKTERHGGIETVLVICLEFGAGPSGGAEFRELKYQADLDGDGTWESANDTFENANTDPDNDALFTSFGTAFYYTEWE